MMNKWRSGIRRTIRHYAGPLGTLTRTTRKNWLSMNGVVKNILNTTITSSVTMSYEDDIVRPYREQLSIENLAAGQINRIMEARSKKMTEIFEESVDALIDLLPPEMEESILNYKEKNNIKYDTSIEGKMKYVQLFREIKKQLSKCNIIWKRGVFELGHD